MHRRHKIRSPDSLEDGRPGRRDYYAAKDEERQMTSNQSSATTGRDIPRHEHSSNSHSFSRSLSRSPIRGRSWSRSRSRSPGPRGSVSPPYRGRERGMPRRQHSPYRERYDDYGPRGSRRWARGREERDFERRPMGRWGEDRRRHSGGGEGGPAMMTFRQFMGTLPDDIAETAAVERYSQYKAEYVSHELEEFFDTHCHEFWFEERYNPRVKAMREDQLAATAMKKSKIFWQMESKLRQLSLEQGSQDEVVKALGEVNNLYNAMLEQEDQADESNDASSTIQQADAANQAKKDGAEGAMRKAGSLPEIYIMNIPPTVSREDLWEACQQVGKVLKLSLGEPIASKHYFRFAWASYSTTVNVKTAANKLDGVQIKDYICQCSAVTKPLPVRVRYIPYMAHSRQRVERDLQQSKEMIILLDKRKGLASEATNPLLSDVLSRDIAHGDGGEGQEEGETQSEDGDKIAEEQRQIKLLDMRLLYLRIVHHYSYYCGVVGDDEDDLVRQGGYAHVRGRLGGLDEKQAVEGWTQAVDDMVEQLAATLGPEPEQKPRGYKDIDQEINAFMESRIDQVELERFKCLLCGKMFKGDEFVRKHINNKHQADMAKVQEKTQYFNNYVLDPAHPTQQNFMQPPPPLSMNAMGPPPPYSNGPMRMPMMGMQPPMPLMPFGGPPPMRGPPGMYPGPAMHGDHFPPYRHTPNDFMPPPMSHMDPRANNLRDYRDLDAPTGHYRSLDFRDPVSYADL